MLTGFFSSKISLSFQIFRQYCGPQLLTAMLELISQIFSCTIHAQNITFHSFSHIEEMMLNYAVDKRKNQGKKKVA